MLSHVFATLVHGATLFRAETAHLPAAVQAWMWTMRIVLGASLVFLPRRGAMATLAVMVVTGVSRFYVKGLYPQLAAAQIGAMSHIVLWLPLAIFLLFTLRERRPVRPTPRDRAYRYWRIAVLALIAVSLAFDVREAAALFA